MEAILLKSIKLNDEEDFVVFDELINGMLTKEFFIPVFTGCDNGMRLITLSYLIENYRFPKKEGKVKAGLFHFLKTGYPNLIERMEFYESDEIEI